MQQTNLNISIGDVLLRNKTGQKYVILHVDKLWCIYKILGNPHTWKIFKDYMEREDHKIIDKINPEMLELLYGN